MRWFADLWTYDLRTDSRFTLKKNPMKPEHLADFDRQAFAPSDLDRRHRKESDRFRRRRAADLLARKQVNLDIARLSPEASAAKEPPASIDALTRSVAGDLRSALAEIEAFAQDLGVDLATVSERVEARGPSHSVGVTGTQESSETTFPR